MAHKHPVWAAGLVACLLLGGPAGCAVQAPPASASQVRPGFVTDMSAFDAFIATRPAPDTFRRAYPDVQLVLPGEITTQQYRTNNSRYFGRLDAEGRITGGEFR